MEKKKNMEEVTENDEIVSDENLSENNENQDDLTSSNLEDNSQEKTSVSDDEYEEVTGLDEQKESKSGFKKFGSDLLKDALEAAQALENARKKKKEEKKDDSKFRDDLKARDESVKTNFDKKYIFELEAKISKLEDDFEKRDTQYKRLAADFENFRRRQDSEKENLLKFGAENLLLDILPVIDNFDRAIDVSKKAKDMDSLLTGIELIKRQLIESMYKNGLEVIQALDTPFDPNFHESVQKIVDDTKEDQTVIHEVQKGYTLFGKVIRPTTVVISATSEEENN